MTQLLYQGNRIIPYQRKINHDELHLFPKDPTGELQVKMSCCCLMLETQLSGTGKMLSVINKKVLMHMK